MPSFEFNVDTLILFLGVLSSLLFSYFPKINEWLAIKPENFKQLFMLGLMVVITGVVFAGGCLGWLFPENFVCGKESVLHFVWVLIMGIISQQGAYKVSPQTARIKAIKATSKEKDILENKFTAG